MFNNTVCVSCPARGAICEDGQMTLVAGFWYDAKENGMLDSFWYERSLGRIDSSFNLYRCAPDACTIDNVTGFPACNEGRGGTLCAECKSGFYAASGGSCSRCPTGNSKWSWLLLLALAALLAKCCHVVKKKQKQNAEDMPGELMEVSLRADACQARARANANVPPASLSTFCRPSLNCLSLSLACTKS